MLTCSYGVFNLSRLFFSSRVSPLSLTSRIIALEVEAFAPIWRLEVQEALAYA